MDYSGSQDWSWALASGRTGGGGTESLMTGCTLLNISLRGILKYLHASKDFQVYRRKDTSLSRRHGVRLNSHRRSSAAVLRNVVDINGGIALS